MSPVSNPKGQGSEARGRLDTIVHRVYFTGQVMRLFLKRIQSRWGSEGGYRELLTMAVPLILSTGAWSILHFVDRMFLTWYSPESIAASMPAGILNFTLCSLFIGTAGYANTFVAQYFGAGRNERIGACVWQGLYIALIGGVVLIAVAPAAGALFRLIGHAPEIQALEAVYFRILCLGSFFPIASSAMTSFFSGRGRNWPIMVVSSSACVVNVILDYALIFGNWGLPEMGIAGAAIATVISGGCSFAAYVILIFRPAFNRLYHTLRNWRPDRELLGRMLRYGLPSGIQFFLDISGFTAFLLLVGRLGMVELAATNIAFNINTLAFMPMMGFGIAISVKVGQSLGDNRPDLAEKSVYSGAHLTFLYMGLVSLSYVLLPEVYMSAFAARADPQSFAPIRRLVVVLLRFVAIYTLSDTANIVFASAIKGAGDTRFVMLMIVGMAIGALVTPTFLALVVFGASIYAAWVILAVYITLLGGSFLLRFLSGKWKSMRVIEQAPHSMPPQYPEIPSTEYEL